MFESDDFDEVLSQFDFPLNETRQTEKKNHCSNQDDRHVSPLLINHESNENIQNPSEEVIAKTTDQSINENVHNGSVVVSPKHIKRKVIDSHFDPKSKRKFPGPAGLLTGNYEEAKDETICDMELYSQDIEFSQNNLRRDLFELPVWNRLLNDVKSWNLTDIESIKDIKQQAVAGNLRRKKAKTVTAYIERVDRSVIDPLIILRDTTGSIKCTLHRDAWSTFSPYLVSEYCLIVLLRPTVLTTGSAFKKHYLNITLSNIYAIYSSAILNDEEKQLPDGYTKLSEENFTLIKNEVSPQNLGSEVTSKEPDSDANIFLEGLDASIFSEDIF